MKADLYDRTHPDWAPSLNMGTGSEGENDDTNTSRAKMRYDRAERRKEKRGEYQVAEALISLQKETPTGEEIDIPLKEPSEVVRKPRCTFLLLGKLEKAETVKEPVILDQFRSEFQRVTCENSSLKEELNSSRFLPESMGKDPEKTKHYTGLTYISLMAVFHFIEEYIPLSAKSVLTKFEKMMMVLMKLRLNLTVQDLGYRFKVSPSCVSKNFSDVMHIMYIRMQPLILWPDREDLRLSMPMEFRKHFGVKISIIIDCFEIFIERPSGYEARAVTWSNYKHHNTSKCLIGITPQGAVSFISEGYGGRASDKFVTEDCGLLSKLLLGDIVLADRGFDIRDSVGVHCAEVKIPAFTRGKRQLSPLELESTRKIASTRIHVERVIGLVRNKYKILQSTLPVDYLLSRSDCAPTVDKLVTVCCALSNMCESVVPFN